MDGLNFWINIILELAKNINSPLTDAGTALNSEQNHSKSGSILAYYQDIVYIGFITNPL